MDERPATEDAAGPPADKPPDRPEVKSGVELPPKVSELRAKLGREAKQESNRPYRIPEGESLYAHLRRLGYRPLEATRG